ncbi:MAG: PD-(D/E)XK nuclease family protein [Prosthecobacter sp.]
MNCTDFERLEALLGGFNLFQVLKFEHGEIRHSNVLAWILDPAESHGLGDSFLKKWLMRAMHESPDDSEVPVSAVDIDGWQLQNVEVRREWRNIDVLVVLSMMGGRQWILCIENKIHSAQHSNQLQRYRSIVEEQFPAAERRIFLFLTKDDEQPDDGTYVRTSYAQVHKALKDCLESRSHTMGSEPRVLLENYLRLLEEKFMNESEIARTALKIYQQHRRALDIIFEHRPDNLRIISEKVRMLLTENAKSLGIQMEACSKSYVRFIPKSWDHPGNTHATNWSGSTRTILFELNLGGKRPNLFIVSGRAPHSWIEPLWKKSASAPFRRTSRRVNRPQFWCSLHAAPQSRTALDEDSMDLGETAQKIFDWIQNAYLDKDTQDVIQIISDKMPALEKAFTA